MFVLILRAAMISGLIVYLFAAVARAQEIQPSPLPLLTPSPSPEIAPSPEVAPTPATKLEDLSGVPNVAPSYQFENRSLPEINRVGVDVLEQKVLTLREALELALANNKDIEVSRQNTRITEFDLQAFQGVYEPRFVSQSFYERATIPVTNSFQGGADGKITSSNFATNSTFTALEPRFGGNFRVDFNNSRQTNTAIINILNPQFSTNLNFQYSQPLLRGRRFDQNRRSIEIAKKNLSLNDVQFRQRTIEVINNVQRAYWDLTFALKNLQVQRDSVRDARERLESNQRLVNEGLLAPIDVVAVETQIANFEQGIYDALNSVTIAENTLKNLIATSRTDNLWATAIIPIDPVEIEAPTIALPEALADALANRPEVEQNKVNAEINEIDRRFFKEQTKPQVDLVANYNLAGLAGSEIDLVNSPFNNPSTSLKINEIIDRLNAPLPSGDPNRIAPLAIIPNSGVPDNLRGGFFNSLGNLFANRYPTFRAGVTINLPFKSDTAEAQLGRSLVEQTRIQTQREQLEQNIQVDVRNALQFVRTTQARLRSAAIARENSQKQYDSEQRKFDNGQSTVFLVLERQTALATAKGSELRAQTELNKAIADLQRATGNSLRANNIIARIK